MRSAAVFALALAACVDVPEPYDLDHARVMAVRIEPPALAPGETARIDVLVTDSSVQPRVADASAVEIRSPAGPLALAKDDRGWTITAPSMAELAAIRSARGLATEADVIAPLELDVTTADGVLPAQKTIAFGTPGANPSAIAIDGAGEEIVIPAGRTATFDASPVAEGLSYRWFSSVGDLTGYTRARVEVDPDRGAEGALVLVVRDQAGGTAWTIVPARVEP